MQAVSRIVREISMKEASVLTWKADRVGFFPGGKFSRRHLEEETVAGAFAAWTESITMTRLDLSSFLPEFAPLGSCFASPEGRSATGGLLLLGRVLARRTAKEADEDQGSPGEGEQDAEKDQGLERKWQFHGTRAPERGGIRLFPPVTIRSRSYAEPPPSTR